MFFGGEEKCIIVSPRKRVIASLRCCSPLSLAHCSVSAVSNGWQAWWKYWHQGEGAYTINISRSVMASSSQNIFFFSNMRAWPNKKETLPHWNWIIKYTSFLTIHFYFLHSVCTLQISIGWLYVVTSVIPLAL